MTPNPRQNGPVAGSNLQDGLFSLLPPSRLGREGRSHSVTSIFSPNRNGSLANPSGVPAPPGSFTADLKSQMLRMDSSRLDLASSSPSAGFLDESLQSMDTEQRQADYKERIDKETKIKIGSENLLEALSVKHPKQTKDQRRVVEAELNASNRKIAQLKLDLEHEIKRSVEKQQATSGNRPTSQAWAPDYARSQSLAGLQDGSVATPTSPEAEHESPSYMLAEVLQALEATDMQPDHHISHANGLVNLLKRHPTLKYDLVWSNFGLRMQIMLLSDQKEIVAVAYRVLRHTITDRKSLQTIRSHHTDYLVIISLVKDSKASVEREQALKFVRTFLEVKNGTFELSLPVVRILVAIAENKEDRLRSMCIMTLAEMLIRAPSLVIAADGLGVLLECLGNGTYEAPETLVPCLLHLLDMPSRRNLLRSGFEFGAAFAIFSETSANEPDSATRLKCSSKVVTTLFRSWPGLMALSNHGFLSVQALIAAVVAGPVEIRNAALDVFFEVLHIRSPAWSSSFLAGRRLTTYGRVTNMRSEPTNVAPVTMSEDGEDRVNPVDHFTAAVLALLIKGGLVPALLQADHNATDAALKRKTTLLIGEVLKQANHLLPMSWSSSLQVLPELFGAAADFGLDERFLSLATIYHVDSVNRTLWRSAQSTSFTSNALKYGDESALSQAARTTTQSSKVQMSANMDEAQFRNLLLESQVLNTVNYAKWRWDLIQPMIDGPLTNPKRLDEAMRATKFIHRLLGFLRPFKYRFSDVKNTKPNQKYVKAGCSLIRTLLQTQEGAKYLAENKLVRQLAECLAQHDRMSGITSATPLFSVDRLAETLVGGYFAMLGVLCSDSKGLQLMERWRIINMFYHIVELQNRDDLVQALLLNLDYTIDSHPRIILAKALTSGSKEIRIASTRILREYAMLPMDAAPGTTPNPECAGWAIRLLAAQIYDCEVEVCELAIKILEESCNDQGSLEFVVKCRPALDHLGEIGAPLLLRFLSTSAGYAYLDQLDYITREMDDWFLGRNDAYVGLFEAWLAKTLSVPTGRPTTSGDDSGHGHQGQDSIPRHFYKELTRTAEGCKLLREKGHFEEFAAVIIDNGMEYQDSETILKVKGCLWAVGNVGSMELGSPFLEQSNVTEKIIEIAESSKVITLRGTAFFVLGLISRSLHGQEILAEHGWDGTVNMRGEALGYCLPEDFDQLFSVRILVLLLLEVRKAWLTCTADELRGAEDHGDP